ncbi:MAG: hypothetical protein O2905_04465 [Proteobacteria bacterium]|nr:hypothetical protein [Pseudomonadota bacterium]
MRNETDSRFAVLGGGRRVWAVGAIHGEAGRLRALHDALNERFEPGDRLVYLGNFLGHGVHVVAAENEMLRQRIAILSRPGADPEDIAYLRGAQEEMWRKLMQLQFAPGPGEVLDWMLGQGVDATLRAYGQNAQDGRAACREGALAIARWTTQIRAAVHGHPGHDELMSALRRAAFTADGELLFVAAGIDPGRPLGQQGDTFWWGSGFFAGIEASYSGYRRIVRGHDRSGGALDLESYAVTLDGGCGRGGTLAAACFGLDGAMLDWLEA